MVEGHFYDLQIFSDVGKTNTIYRDRIFCTDQDINQTTNNHYELNEGQYTTYDGFNNDYIVIWEKETKKGNLAKQKYQSLAL